MAYVQEGRGSESTPAPANQPANNTAGKQPRVQGQQAPQGQGPQISPRPPVDTTGTATTTHAAPTIADAIDAPAAAPASATEAHVANVKLVADRSAPAEVSPSVCPAPSVVYLEAPAAQAPAAPAPEAQAPAEGATAGATAAPHPAPAPTPTPAPTPAPAAAGTAPAPSPGPTPAPTQASPIPAGFTPITGFNGTMAAPQVEQVMTPNLYINNQPSPNDVQQQGIGDCYFMATLMSISQRDPGKIKSMMSPDGSGGATVTFWKRKMVDPNWLKKLFGSKPKPEYEQVQIHVSEQLQYWLQTPYGAGQRFANGHGGFQLKGAALRADANPRGTKWWGNIAASQLEVHRRDEYDTALWAPLLEKAFAAFAERYGQYGGSQGDTPATGSGYDAINGGWSHQAMFVFYGAQADMSGANEGGVQQQQTQWAPGSSVLAANPRVVDQLILLQGKPAAPAAGETQAPVMTATSMVYALIPRLLAAIPPAQGDPDYNNLSATEKANVTSISLAINTYNALPNDPATTPNGPKSQARAAVGTACANAVTLASAPGLLNPSRSAPIKSMVELALDLKNIGTDNSKGQRNIYGDHVYSVTGVNFCTTAGAAVPLSATPQAGRAALFPQVDTTVSNITLRNPHHQNTPDPTGSGVGPDGPTQGVNSTGIFHMNLEQFFRNYTSVETGVFPKT